MKRVFIIAMAIASAVACSKSDVIEAPQGVAIEFDNIFVNNSTRANDLNQGNIPDFGVYGYVVVDDQQGLIFENQKVTNTGATGYTYSPAQYWIANAQYHFTAFAPFTDAAWSYKTTDAQNGTITFNNATAKANQDFLFAYNAPAKTPATITSKPAAVAFDFNHMLSRVRFSFINGFGAGSNISLKVTDVTITNAYASGTLAVASGAPAAEWAPVDNTNSLSVDFGDVDTTLEDTTLEGESTTTGSTEHFYLIPAETTYNVTFNVELLQAGVSVDNYERTATVAVDMARGCRYDLKATLTAANTSDDGVLYPIEFTVGSVADWADYADVNGTTN